jgi:hypothetical protein
LDQLQQRIELADCRRTEQLLRRYKLNHSAEGLCAVAALSELSGSLASSEVAAIAAAVGTGGADQVYIAAIKQSAS